MKVELYDVKLPDIIFQASDGRRIAIEIETLRKCSNKAELDMTTFGIFDINGFIPYQLSDGRRMISEIDTGIKPIHLGP